MSGRKLRSKFGVEETSPDEHEQNITPLQANSLASARTRADMDPCTTNVGVRFSAGSYVKPLVLAGKPLDSGIISPISGNKIGHENNDFDERMLTVLS